MGTNCKMHTYTRLLKGTFHVTAYIKITLDYRLLGL